MSQLPSYRQTMEKLPSYSSIEPINLNFSGSVRQPSGMILVVPTAPEITSEPSAPILSREDMNNIVLRNRQNMRNINQQIFRQRLNEGKYIARTLATRASQNPTERLRRIFNLPN